MSDSPDDDAVGRKGAVQPSGTRRQKRPLSSRVADVAVSVLFGIAVFGALDLLLALFAADWLATVPVLHAWAPHVVLVALLSVAALLAADAIDERRRVARGDAIDLTPEFCAYITEADGTRYYDVHFRPTLLLLLNHRKPQQNGGYRGLRDFKAGMKSLGEVILAHHHASGGADMPAEIRAAPVLDGAVVNFLREKSNGFTETALTEEEMRDRRRAMRLGYVNLIIARRLLNGGKGWCVALCNSRFKRTLDGGPGGQLICQGIPGVRPSPRPSGAVFLDVHSSAPSARRAQQPTPPPKDGRHSAPTKRRHW
jgi:hypothetical protein